MGLDGSIDFMCFPDFDSPTVFAALLDDRKGGSFRLAPKSEDVKRRQLYLPDTNVLLTRTLATDGVSEVSDFMPVEDTGPEHNIVRRVKTVRGEILYRMVCDPRFGYGRVHHRTERTPGGIAFLPENGAEPLRLIASVPLELREGRAEAHFTLRAGETASFVLEAVTPREPTPALREGYVSETFKKTVNYWRQWVGRSTYRGRWHDQVMRSALTLKLLTSSRHGSVVAAPTFGLPEAIGGPRNWDYRYTWIRDSAFTIYSLLRLGFTDEATAFVRWVEKRCTCAVRNGPPLMTMYRLNGDADLEEEVLEHLEGYRGSSPVRVGNGAAQQLQLDIYGELMDAVYLHDKYVHPVSYDLWQVLKRMVDWVCENWNRPDEGIWEVRGGRQHFLFSRVLCWVALDRAVRLARKRALPAPLERWAHERDAIYVDVMENFWDARAGHFVQHLGSRALDASALVLPLVRFVGPRDPRWLSTLTAIERELADDSLVHRYRPKTAASDGLLGGEGSFSTCSFWLVECLSRSGDLQKARFYFDKMLGYANHLGLYSEELGPQGEHLGNFPQAFTHIALISAAFDLDRRLSAAGWSA